MLFKLEPGIVIDDSTVTQDDYIHGREPLELHGYLKDFAAPNTKITSANDGPQLFHCSGTHTNSAHIYLAFEGTFECKRCNESFCKTCSYVPELDKQKKKKVDEKNYYQDCNQVMCLSCFRLSRLGSQNDADTEETNISIDDMKK